jgi:hypothetical protein
MGIREKMKYVLDHPGAFPEYFALEKRLAGNRRRGIRNFLFQCDAKGHFPYLKPYFDALKDRPDVDIFLTGADLDGEVGSSSGATGSGRTGSSGTARLCG